MRLRLCVCVYTHTHTHTGALAILKAPVEPLAFPKAPTQPGSPSRVRENLAQKYREHIMRRICSLQSSSCSRERGYIYIYIYIYLSLYIYRYRGGVSGAGPERTYSIEMCSLQRIHSIRNHTSTCVWRGTREKIFYREHILKRTYCTDREHILYTPPQGESGAGADLLTFYTEHIL
jgi:hypothetical protein